MTQDEIIEMARQAASIHGHTLKTIPEQATIEFIEAFAKLVAQHEREACAQMLEKASKTGKIISCISAAHAIRARGQA